jgi:hypothetical protein
MKIDDTSIVGKRGRGRPKKSPGERVSRTLAVRVTYAEALALRRLAKAAGKQLTAYHRDLLRQHLGL